MRPNSVSTGRTDRQLDSRRSRRNPRKPLVDPDALGRLGVAALACGAARGALLVVDQHGDPLDLGQLQLRGSSSPRSRSSADRRQRDARSGQSSAVTMITLDALEQPAGQVGDRELSLDRLAARHGHMLVVEQLVGEVHLGGDRRADRQQPEWWNVPSPRF